MKHPCHEQIELLFSGIKQLRKQEEEAEAKLREIESNISNLLDHAIRLKYGVKVGSRVISNGKEYEVTFTNSHGFFSGPDSGAPWLRGKLIKKDGTVSSRVVTIHRQWSLKPET